MAYSGCVFYLFVPNRSCNTGGYAVIFLSVAPDPYVIESPTQATSIISSNTSTGGGGGESLQKTQVTNKMESTRAFNIKKKKKLSIK